MSASLVAVGRKAKSFHVLFCAGQLRVWSQHLLSFGCPVRHDAVSSCWCFSRLTCHPRVRQFSHFVLCFRTRFANFSLDEHSDFVPRCLASMRFANGSLAPQNLAVRASEGLEELRLLKTSFSMMKPVLHYKMGANGDPLVMLHARMYPTR